MPQVSDAKFLGVFVDMRFSWREQADYVSRKIHKSIGIVRRIGILVLQCLLSLYYNLIYPCLSYCCIAWASNFPNTLQRNVILQKLFVIGTRSNAYIALLLYFRNLRYYFMKLTFLKFVFSFIRYIQVAQHSRTI